MNKAKWVLVILLPILVICFVLTGCVLLWFGASFDQGPFSSESQARFLIPLQGGTRVLLEADVPKESSISREEIESEAAIIHRRLAGLGVYAITRVQDERHLEVQIAGNPEAIRALTSMGLLEFIDAGETALEPGKSVQTTGLTGAAVAQSPTSAKLYRTIMTGKDLANASIAFQQTTNQPYIAFSLTSQGTRIFADFTSKNINKYLAIVIDKKVVSCPVIKSAITEGSGIIEGQFTQQEAQDLVVQLKYGALPFPLKIVETMPIRR